MSASDQIKEAFIRLDEGHRCYENKTITHMLHEHHPRFLELNARWVDVLLEAEGNMKDKDG